MSGIYASPITALVANAHILGNGTDLNLPAQPVSPLMGPFGSHHPITLRSAASPPPTLVTRSALHSVPKSSLYFDVHGFGSSDGKNGRAKTSEVERCKGSALDSRPKICARRLRQNSKLPVEDKSLIDLSVLK